MPDLQAAVEHGRDIGVAGLLLLSVGGAELLKGPMEELFAIAADKLTSAVVGFKVDCSKSLMAFPVFLMAWPGFFISLSTVLIGTVTAPDLMDPLEQVSGL